MFNILSHYIDIKLFFAGLVFGFISFSNFEVTLKIIASVLMIGYTIDRWIHFRKTKNQKKTDDEQL